MQYSLGCTINFIMTSDSKDSHHAENKERINAKIINMFGSLIELKSIYTIKIL